MSLLNAIKEEINSLKPEEVFKVAQMATDLKSEVKSISVYISRFASLGFIERVSKGAYKKMLDIPEDIKSMTQEIKIPETPVVEEEESDKETEDNHAIPAKEAVEFIGKKYKKSPIFEILANTGMLEVICKDGISFKVHVRGTCLERNYRGEILRFSLSDVSISVCDDERTSTVDKRKG